MIHLFNGNCLHELLYLSDNSVDAVVTDPPYGLSFMGKKWDYDVPSVAIWKEVLRVLKPGGHVLSFGGTRTYHRMVVNIEDAGFEIRDQVMWIYGSGFPKSHNISKAIDKMAGAEREVVGSREVKSGGKTFHGQNYKLHENLDVTAPSTPEAKQWDGWGSALKPANEPICLARKPLEKGLTLADNVLKWGTGGLNIDGTRIGTDTIQSIGRPNGGDKMQKFKGEGVQDQKNQVLGTHQGRWPANVLFDEDAAAVLDEQSGNSKSTGGTGAIKNQRNIQQWSNEENIPFYYGDSGRASRFFYVAKASKRERNLGLEGMLEKNTWAENREPNSNDIMTMKRVNSRTGKLEDRKEVTKSANNHPTVKPVKLMEYLITLITPPGGIVLDPFMGSGTTGIAAKKLKREFIGVEMNKEYFNIASKRIGK